MHAPAKDEGMRITTRITWDMASGEVLEHQWYEYAGPVAQCKIDPLDPTGVSQVTGQPVSSGTFTPRPTPWQGWRAPTGTDPRLASPMGQFMQQHPGMGYYNAAGSMNPADWSYAPTTPTAPGAPPAMANQFRQMRQTPVFPTSPYAAGGRQMPFRGRFGGIRPARRTRFGGF